MSKGPQIAILGGARETAQAVDWVLHARARGQVIWGAGAEAEPLPLAVGSMDQVTDADGVLDVTHAFDEKTRHSAMAVASQLPYARMGRAAWHPTDADQWTEVDSLEQAVAALPKGARVFAATGRGSLTALATHDGPVFLRQLSVHNLPMPLEHGQYVFGAAPFSVAQEVELLRRLQIDVVLARNIGGPHSFPKLAAARHLALPAVLLRPPALPDGPHLRSFEDVRAWVQTLPCEP